MAKFRPAPSYRRQIRAAVAPQINQVAERVASAAAANTPVRSGALAGSWAVERSRAGLVTVGSTDWRAHFLEFGTVHGPEVAMLRRACDQLGLDIQ